jgi:hypothetical protein
MNPGMSVHTKKLPFIAATALLTAARADNRDNLPTDPLSAIAASLTVGSVDEIRNTFMLSHPSSVNRTMFLRDTPGAIVFSEDFS